MYKYFIKPTVYCEMKIFTKLILALLLTSLLILTIIFTVVQLSFDRGMLEYVNQKQLENLQKLSENLSRYYQKKGSWQHLLAGNDLKQARPQQKPFSRHGQPRSGKHLKQNLHMALFHKRIRHG